MVAPFLPAFAWALALSVAVHPLRWRLMARLPRTPAAILTVFIVLVVLAVPGILLVHELIDESTSGIAALRNTVDLSAWRQVAESNRFLQPLLAALGRLDVEVNDVGRANREPAGRLANPRPCALRLGPLASGHVSIRLLFLCEGSGIDDRGDSIKTSSNRR